MTDLPANYDVAIVGAGPAGCAAAIHLARTGLRVGLLERKFFPRQKVCGGCLSARAVAELRHLLGTDQPPPGIAGRRITFVMGAYRIACDPLGATRIVVRPQLDAQLAACAVSNGAELHEGQTADLIRAGGRWELRVGERRVRASHILLAGGLGVLPRFPWVQRRRAGRPMISQQWIQPSGNGLPRPGEVEMHWLRGGYVGLACPQPDHCVVALAADAPPDAAQPILQRLKALNPAAGIWSLIPADAPQRYDAKGSTGFPWTPEKLGCGNVLLIGDLAGFAEPYSGEGIAQALHSASCAAEAILGTRNVLTRYTELMTRHHRRVVGRTRWVGRILRTAALQKLASQRAFLPQRLLQLALEYLHVRSSP